MNRLHAWFSTVLLVSVTCTSAGTGLAQQVDSNRLVQLTLQVDGQVFSGAVREGDAFRMEVDAQWGYELIPVLTTANSTAVILAVYRARLDDPSTRRLVERLELAVGEPASLRTQPEWRVVVDGVRTPGQAGLRGVMQFAAARCRGRRWAATAACAVRTSVHVHAA